MTFWIIKNGLIKLDLYDPCVLWVMTYYFLLCTRIWTNNFPKNCIRKVQSIIKEQVSRPTRDLKPVEKDRFMSNVNVSVFLMFVSLVCTTVKCTTSSTSNFTIIVTWILKHSLRLYCSPDPTTNPETTNSNFSRFFLPIITSFTTLFCWFVCNFCQKQSSIWF